MSAAQASRRTTGPQKKPRTLTSSQPVIPSLFTPRSAPDVPSSSNSLPAVPSLCTTPGEPLGHDEVAHLDPENDSDFWAPGY